MGFRFRKSTKIGPVRINFSKSGVGYSVGSKGFRVTKRADGRVQQTYNIPGTGISYVETSSGNSRKYNNIEHDHNNYNGTGYKILKFIFLSTITGGIYLYYRLFKLIKTNSKR